MKYWYHYSKEDYCGPDFDPGTHFGTFQAARDRWYQTGRYPGCLVETRIHSTNPYRTYDQGTWSHPMVFLFEIADEAEVAALVKEYGFIWPWDGTEDDKLDVLADIDGMLQPFSWSKTQEYDHVWKRVLWELEDQGYDAISYRNEAEDPGSTSLIIFDPGQVEVVGVAYVPAQEGSLDTWWSGVPFEDPSSLDPW